MNATSVVSHGLILKVAMEFYFSNNRLATHLTLLSEMLFYAQKPLLNPVLGL